MSEHWISCLKFTVRVTTDDEGKIVKAAPLVRKFIGQPLANLLRWARSLGGFAYEVL
jgi:hypothetical protein